MITKGIAMGLTHGTLHHVRVKNADGTPARCRVNGKCKTWKTRPAEWKLPVKHGLRGTFYITPQNAHEWLTLEQGEDASFVALHQAVLAGDCPMGVLHDKCRDIGIME